MDLNISVPHFLKTKLEALQAKNRSYSMRAFAKKIGLSPGGLAQVLSGKKRLSLERAHEVAAGLGLKGKERDFFLLCADFEQARGPERKASVLERLNSLAERGQAAFFDLGVEQFRLISDWYGPAILECVSTYGANMDAKALAGHFGITTAQASVTLDRLLRLEIIEKGTVGQWVRVRERMMIASTLPSEALRKHYSSVSQKSLDSYREQTPQEKVCGTEIFAFDDEQLEELRTLTDRYLDSLQELAMKGKKKKNTYQAIVNVFRLNKRQEKEN